ncbi:subunit 2 of condensin complex [Mitosporidium daphniae]|uniref:Condensin complex subunit 2 n=1 Tax=Mitosporidium daphniae TaxID=1485682 RepID=A0A098VVS3_9MICR|nr:subunit 2 of condensin complex [Mitosporidium daphniae]KGG53020.1 subunit 2 of condensin complex [Mitosporidium daphniae]|eukprot:XP_013239456.1 subunit 2 of condensin complex [Mitosporidium daphniae]
MTLLKDNNDDINFQKASSTLDGCVKIYSSRVESVVVDTGKLLSGLTTSAGLNSIENEENRPSNKLNEKVPNKHKKKTFESINVKSFDLDTSLDPLFKKISAEFDEGGYKGLLFNRLSIDQSGSYMLDPSGIFFMSQDQMEHDGNIEFNTQQRDHIIEGDGQEPNKAFDEGLLAGIGSFLKSFTQIPCTISPSFEGFQKEFLDVKSAEPFDFGEDVIAEILEQLKLSSAVDYDTMHIDSSFEDGVSSKVEHLQIPDYPLTLDETGEEDGYHFPSEQRFGNDDDDENCGNVEHMHEDAYQDPSPTLAQMVQNSFSSTSFLANPSAILEANEATNSVDVCSSRSNLFAYFDGMAHKNWAGPEHWKLRLMRKDHSVTSGKKIRQKVTIKTHLIDFCTAPEVDIKSLFVKFDSQHHITLTPEILLSEKNRTRNMLPEDLNISSKDLFSMFCKPNWWFADNIKRPSSGAYKASEEPIEETAEKLLHTQGAKFLVEKGLEAMVETNQRTHAISDDFSQPDDDIPFEPFDHGHENHGDDINGDDNDHDGDDHRLLGARDASDESLFSQPFSQLSLGEDFPSIPSSSSLSKDWGPMGSPKFLRVDSISYCKVSKRVNMHRLKSTMWTSLSNSFSSEDEIRLSSVISAIDAQAMGGEKKKAELSFPYCFISLLHLANEHNLILALTATHSDIAIKKQTSKSQYL